MSKAKKISRLRQQVQHLKKEIDQINRELCVKNEQLEREAAKLKKSSELLNCFRLRISRMPFGRMGGDVLSIAVSMDPMMIRYGILEDGNHMVNLSRHVHYIVEELAYKIRDELMTQLTETIATRY